MPRGFRWFHVWMVTATVAVGLVSWTANGDVLPAELQTWRHASGAGPATSLADGSVRLPVDFSGEEQRAYWDIPVQADLATVRGIRFSVRCSNPEPIQYANVYLRATGGWYQREFPLAADGEWCDVEIDKFAMAAEESPQGFSRIDTIRISAWRASAGTTELAIRDFELVPAKGDMILVRADSAMTDGRGRTVTDLTQKLATALDRLGLDCVPLADMDLNQETLAGKSLLIFPYNPTVPDALWPALESYVAAGGKLLTFFSPPARLAELNGIRLGAFTKPETPGGFSRIVATADAPAGMPGSTAQASWNITSAQPATGEGRVAAWWHDAEGARTGQAAIITTPTGVHMTHVFLDQDAENGPRLLLSMLGAAVPGLWETAVRTRLKEAGAFAGFENTTAAIEFLGMSEATVARAFVDEAKVYLANAEAHMDAGNFPEALGAANSVSTALLSAYAAGQPAKPGEWRGFWCHDAYGVSGMTWDEAIGTLAKNGFNAVLPNMLWGGVAYYPSTVLPVAPAVAEHGDALAECLAACKKYNVECHLWKVNWNMGGKAPAAFKARMNEEGRTQVSRDGTKQPDWLCPSHPENQQLEIDAMVEVATKYDVDGVHFDYIRYPDANHCYCAGCRTRFEARIGAKIADWPGALQSDTLGEEWHAFRRGNISRVVSEVARILDEKRPEVKVSAAVFRNWPRDRETIAQDWGAWCQAGWLDFVCPMDYTESTDDFRRMVTRQREWAGDAPVYPGIGLSTWQIENPVLTLFAQIRAARTAGATGFTVFNYGTREARSVLPLCGLGITRPQMVLE